MKKTVIKLIAAATLCMGALFTAIPSQAATKNEAAAKNVANQFFTYVKTYDVAKMRKLQSKNLDYKTYDKNNEKEKALCKKYLKQMYSYKITNVKTAGSDIRVTAKVVYPDAYCMAYAAIDETYNYNLAHISSTHDEINTYFIKRLTKRLEMTNPDRAAITVTLNLKNTDDGWKINRISKTFNPVMVMEIMDGIDGWCSNL